MHGMRTLIAVGTVFAVLAAVGMGARLPVVTSASTAIVDTSSSLTVTAINGFHFTPNVIDDLPVNTTITLTFDNGDTGGLIHTFTIIGCANVSIPTGGALTNWINGTSPPGCSAAPIANVGPIPAGSLVRSIPAVPAVGWYEFVCTTPGHFAAGMYGFIAFGTSVPANLAPGAGNLGPGLAVFIIVGTIVTLTVIAIVLGFVVGRREGAQHEMPPERLGYPEPVLAPGPEGTPPSAGR